MTLSTTTVPVPRSRRPVRRFTFIALALMAAGVLALAAIVAWQRGGDDAASTAELSVPAASVSAQAPSPSYTVYLTESAAQASALAQDLAVLNPAPGAPLSDEVHILTVQTAEEQDRAQQLIGMLEDVTNGRAVRVVDLRRPVAAAQTGTGGGCEPGPGTGASDVSAC